MPVELKNIKGGGLHYVTYTLHNAATSLQRRPNFSGPVSRITPRTRRDC